MDLNIGNQIKKLRHEHGITQEDVAEYIGVSYQAVSKWETGTTMPDITLLPKLAALFGVHIDDLFQIDHDDELERIDNILYHEQLTDKSFSYAKCTLESILSENENDVGALKRYAELCIKRNNRDTVLVRQMLENAMTVSPTDVEIFSLYRQLCGGGRNYMRSGNDKFINVCEPYAKRYRMNCKLYEMLIETMIDMRYLDKAEEYIDMMQPEESNKYMRCVFLGDLEASKGNVNDAKKIWRSVPTDDHKGQYEVGERFNSIGEYETAIECFKNSFNAAETPRDLSAVYSLAFLYEKLGRYNKAIEAWETIIDVLANDHNITANETVDWAKREIKKLKQRCK